MSVNQDIIEQNGEVVYAWVMSTFYPDKSIDDIQQEGLEEELNTLFAKAIAYLDELETEVSLESIQNYANDIMSWDGSSIQTPEKPNVEQPAKAVPCACEQNSLEIKKLKKRLIIALVVLVLYLIFKK